MAKVRTVNQEIEVKDGEPITDACEQMGVPFACKDGVCGTCRIDIVSGAENLTDLTEQEKTMGGCDRDHRLACQCRIHKGTITINF